MYSGKVKWFDRIKGFGFVQPDDGGQDVFVHISALEQAGIKNLTEGQVVKYELATNRGRTSATNLEVSE